MDGQQSGDRAAEKRKIREMLRDAVRILCQSTVSHHTKLTVEALIGITVDDGEDAIIVSISETVGAAKAEAYQTEEQYDNMAEADDSYYDEYQETGVDDSRQFNNGVDYTDRYDQSFPYQAVVKTEKSAIRHNVGEYGGFPPSSTITSDQATSQYFEADWSHPAPYGGHQGAAGPRHGQQVVASGPRRNRGGGQGLQKRSRKTTSGARTAPAVKQELPAMEVDTTTGGGNTKCSVDKPEVSHVTLYTCQRCGKQYNNQRSFMRHKKSHLGIIYCCDGCGKIVSRQDHLTAHRRHCEAALQQAPLDM